MDQLKIEASFFFQSIPSSNPSIIEFCQPPIDRRVPSTTRTQPKSSQRVEGEAKDCSAARKLQKADREKLRRDRLNEHFLDLEMQLILIGPKMIKQLSLLIRFNC